MCFVISEKDTETLKQEPFRVWKIFRVDDEGRLNSCVFPHVWEEGNNVIDPTPEPVDLFLSWEDGPCFSYESGFHAYLKREDAEAQMVVWKRFHPNFKYVIREFTIQPKQVLGAGPTLFTHEPVVALSELSI